MNTYIPETALSEDELEEAAEQGGFIRAGSVFTAWRRDSRGVLFFRRHDVPGSDPDGERKTSLADYDRMPEIHGTPEGSVDIHSREDEE